MLTAIFQNQAGFIVGGLAAVLIAAAAGYLLGRRITGRSWSCAAFAASVTAELALTLFLPNDGPAGSGGTGMCIINRNFTEPLGTEQGLLNVLLFLPIGFFGLLAFRALLPVLVGSLLLTIATELLQTLVPGVSRGCDSSDVQMNALGGIAGALVAWAVLHLTRHKKIKPAAYAGHAAVGGAIGLGCAAVVWMAWITPTAIDATSLQMTGSKEQTAADKIIHQAFGDHYSIANVQLQSGTQDIPDSLLIALDRGSAQVSWPDTSQLNVTFENSSVTTQNSFPIPGTTGKPHTGRDATAIAKRYAQQHYPDELRGAEVQVAPVGEKAELGWIVSWRRRSPAGVLMPMRLDVQINTAGRISQMLVNTTADPASLPANKIGKEAALRTALAHVGRPKGAQNIRPAESELLAVQRDGRWRTQWIVTFTADGPPVQFEPVYIDATTGDVVKRATQPQKIEQPADEEGTTTTEIN
ncbi:VanZ family protein [Streptomyces chrestomyceticus]|uniref:VanZ family protein n=1 Tax=Streptomyces chrestomyceticus TaxID=68185 RepID=UPI00378C1275